MHNYADMAGGWGNFTKCRPLLYVFLFFIVPLLSFFPLHSRFLFRAYRYCLLGLGKVLGVKNVES